VIDRLPLPGDVRPIRGGACGAARPLWNLPGYSAAVRCRRTLDHGLQALVVSVQEGEALVVVDGAVGWVSVNALEDLT